MKCVILQPSFIPWRGFFHQIQKADIFVFYDSVQYDKNGWRNRNIIKTNSGKQWITVPIISETANYNNKICDVKIAPDKNWKKKQKKTFELNYHKTPYWEEYKYLIGDIYDFDYEYLADLTINTTISIANALGIDNTTFLRSSDLNLDGNRTTRLVSILKDLGANHYISGPSAKSYLDEAVLKKNGITLEFMSYDYPEYPQYKGEFIGEVTILDLLFNVGKNASKYIWDVNAVKNINDFELVYNE
jgi:hypothetical protein